MNKAKNAFIEWLKKNDATTIDVYEGEDDGWDYYRSISGFIENRLHTVIFSVWNGDNNINYSDETNKYPNLSIQEFLDIIKL